MHIQSGAAWSKKLKLTFRETITMCPSNHIISESITRWNHYLARDPPSYDSGIPLPEAVAKIMMDKIEARSKIADGRARRWDRWDNTSSGVGRREGSHPVIEVGVVYQKSTFLFAIYAPHPRKPSVPHRSQECRLGTTHLMGPCGSTWAHMSPNWAHMNPNWVIWKHADSFRNFATPLDGDCFSPF